MTAGEPEGSGRGVGAPDRASAPAQPSVRAILERARTPSSSGFLTAGAGGGRVAAGALRAAIAMARRASSAAAPPATIERVTLEVRIAGRAELVALGLDGGRLLASATDGGGGGSPFVQAALAWLEGATDAVAEPDAPRTSPVPPLPPSGEPRRGADDLRVAISRSGVRAGLTPAVLDALARLSAEHRGAVPLARARWLARVTQALEEGDADLAARLCLAGPPPASVVPEEKVVDRAFIELAREGLSGDAGQTIERRHLLDAARGEVVAEERVLGEPGASFGPCPRVCAVGYGEIFPGLPRRLVVSQYTVAPEVPAAEWERVVGCAVPTGVAARAAREALSAHGDAEPVGLVLGARLEAGRIVDEAGEPYPLAGAEAAPETLALEALLRTEVARWALVRFEVARGSVRAVPLSCGLAHGDRWRHVRLR